MPRRARRDNAESAAVNNAPLLEADAAAETEPTSGYSLSSYANSLPQSELPDTLDVEKPKRRRSPRKKVENTSDVIGDEPTPQVSDQPVIAAITDKKPRRRPQHKDVAPVIEEAVEPTVEPASRRRRVGGRRTAQQIAEELHALELGGDHSTPVTILGLDTQLETEQDQTPAQSAPSRRSRRGNRRRRGRDRNQNATADTVQPAELVDENLPEHVEDILDDSIDPIYESSESEEISADSETGIEPRKSRRSRRGGRRRPKGADSETAIVASEQQAVEPVVEDIYDFSMPIQRIRERYVAPDLVPSVEKLNLAMIELPLKASLNLRDRGFVINGADFRSHLFFVNAEASGDEGKELVSRQIRRAASAGIHLHTTVVYLPLKNAYGERSFSAMDQAIRELVDADPDAQIVLRIQCVPTNYWVRTHQDQMARYQNGNEGDVSIASIAFWSDTVEALASLVEHIADPENPAYNRVFALHLDKGEWFYEPGVGYDYSKVNRDAFRNWLHERYQSDYALCAAWKDGSVRFETAEIPTWEGSGKDRKNESVLYDRPSDRRYVDYLTYASDAVGHVITGLASAVKALSKNALLVFAPYGYIFEFASRTDSGHQALGWVLNSPAIDVLTGPNSYASRNAGGVGGFSAPVDSVRLHNKLWIVEDDTKTYLASGDTPDSYNPKVNGQQETIMVLRRNYFAALAHGCGVAWMDLWGQGWLDSDPIWEEITSLLAYEFQVHESLIKSEPDAAVLVDEASYAWIRNESGGQNVQAGLIAKARDLLLRSGASIGFYLQSDVALLPDSVKVIFFLNAFRVTTDERQAIRERIQRTGKTLVWLYSPGLFDEQGPCPLEVTELVGMPIKPQPWNSRIGTLFTDQRHPVIERLHGGKRMGTEDVLNPSFSAIDPQSVVLGEYVHSGNASIAAKTTEAGWKSIFVGEPHLTGELIRGIFRFGGVHLYDVQDDIIYARGEGIALFHAPYTGQRILHLPKASACYSLFEKRLIVENSASVRLFMRGRTSHVLIWGSIDDIAQKVGITVDELRESYNNRPDQNRERFRDNEFDGEEHRSDSASIQRHDESARDIPSDVQAATHVVSQAPRTNNLSDALREASLITEQILANGEVGIEESEELPEGDEGSDEPLATTDAVGTPRRSRRRRWRRRTNSTAPKADGAPSVSVDDLLSDLASRRNQPRQE